jgi:hypothetical protein
MKPTRGERKQLEHLAVVERGQSICFLKLGGGSPPPPDPAIGQASREMADVAREQLAFSKEAYAESLPRVRAFEELVNKVVQGQITASEEQQDLARDYEKYMKETFRPVERSLVEDAMGFDTPERREKEAARVASQIGLSFDQQADVAKREMARRGSTMSPEGLSSFHRELAASKAASQAAGMNAARDNVEAQGWARRMDASSLGRGLPSAQATSAQIATQQGNSAVGNAGQPINAYDTAARTRGLLTAQGANTYGAAGQLGLGAYGAQLNAWQNSQASKAGALGGLGSLVGLGLSAAVPGGGSVLSHMLKLKTGGIVNAKVTGYKCGGMVKRRRYDEGGLVAGPGGPTDDAVPAQLSDGEGVLNAGAVQLVGEDFVNRINEFGLDLLQARGHNVGV